MQTFRLDAGFSPSVRRTGARAWVVIGTMLIAVELAFIAYMAATMPWPTWLSGTAPHRRPVKVSQGVPAPVPDLPAMVEPASDPAALRILTTQEAERFNDSIPLSTLPNPGAGAFILGKISPPALAKSDMAGALDCLTAAIYYEAASESDDGQRAVAQVVLNRVRHPAFPHNVCGVVYQGSERATGCQFSFTCDGSLARVPIPSAWDHARDLARAALEGKVYGPVGLSTHYHTYQVAPYWATSLVKLARIGAHIFYRWQGHWGEPKAFSAAYAGGEVPVDAGMLDLAGLPLDPAAAPIKLDRPVLPNAIAPVAPTGAVLASAATSPARLIGMAERPVILPGRTRSSAPAADRLLVEDDAVPTVPPLHPAATP